LAPTKNDILVIIFLFLLPNFLISQPLIGNFIDCNQVSLILSTKQINEYSAKDLYTLGICEYKSNNFEKAYNYFISAKSLGFTNENALQIYIIDCKKRISNLSEDEDSILESENQLEINNYKHKVQVYLLNIFFILIALAGLITSIYLFYKYRTIKSNIFLGIFLFAISLALIELVLYWQNFFSYAPTVSIYRVLFFLWAPSLYLYLKTKNTITILTKKEIIFHYLPFFLALVSLIIFGNYYNNNNVQNNSLLNGLNRIMNSNWIKAIHLSAYFVFIIDDFKNKYNLLKYSIKNWMLTLIVFTAILIMYIIARAAFEHIFIFDYISKYFFAVYLILFITVLEILLVVQPKIIIGTFDLHQSNKPKIKYKNSSLTENMRARVTVQLLDALNNDKIYLDNTLTLTKLAKKINVDRYSLSQVINQELDKNFYELINDYRIKETVKIIESNPKKQVVDLIYECGFNNKVSFYKAFKRRMHMTPKEYIEKQMIKA